MPLSVRSRRPLLNVGCGRRAHPDWTNLDLIAATPEVIVADLRTGIPFADGAFQAVYHSHVLEHFSKDGASAFLAECRRVLASGGILRVVVPDLERIARLYLDCLERASKGIEGAAANYDWMMLELYDQTVREQGGGAMFEWFKQQAAKTEFAIGRLGSEAEIMARDARMSHPAAEPGFAQRLGKVANLPKLPGRIRRRLARLLLTKSEFEALQVGEFRRGGEIHLWMYDRFSLGRLLEFVGFREPRVCMANESRISDWPTFQLDADVNGRAHKPDSLFMEAVKST